MYLYVYVLACMCILFGDILCVYTTPVPPRAAVIGMSVAVVVSIVFVILLVFACLCYKNFKRCVPASSAPLVIERIPPTQPAETSQNSNHQVDLAMPSLDNTINKDAKSQTQDPFPSCPAYSAQDLPPNYYNVVSKDNPPDYQTVIPSVIHSWLCSLSQWSQCSSSLLHVPHNINAIY